MDRTRHIIIVAFFHTLPAWAPAACDNANASGPADFPGHPHAARLPDLVAGVDNAPVLQTRVHNVNDIRLPITNWGLFGNDYGLLRDPLTGLTAPGAEYPAGSNLQYLALGGLWVGAQVEDETGDWTLVSTAADADGAPSEFIPVAPWEGGLIEERSTRINSPHYHPDAVSEQDLITVYTDTVTDAAFVSSDPWSFRPHVPIGLVVRQSSYAWSYDYARNFIIIQYELTNVRSSRIREMYVGLNIDPLVTHVATWTFNDDQIGFRPHAQSFFSNSRDLEIHTAWFADNDGDRKGKSGFTAVSPRGAAGVRLVGQPLPPNLCWIDRWMNRSGSNMKPASFNWWVTFGEAGFFYDWGPQHKANVRDPRSPHGVPRGDRAKYAYMSNREFDYDQVYANTDMNGNPDHAVPGGWIPVTAPTTTWGRQVARGADANGLLSAGPYDLEPGESQTVSFAYVAGSFFHLDPQNWRNLPLKPRQWLDNIEFSNLDLAAAWSSWVYDNPGRDTDNDGCAGEFYVTNCRDTFFTVYVDSFTYTYTYQSCNQQGCEFRDTSVTIRNFSYDELSACDTVFTSGDGVPDLLGPPAPTSPDIRITTEPGRIIIEWDGRHSEPQFDPFSQRRDFEGYNVYWGGTATQEAMTPIGSWDIANYYIYRYRPSHGAWDWGTDGIPIPHDSLLIRFGDTFEPDEYQDADHPFVHSNKQMYFVPIGGNRGNSYTEADGGRTVNPLQRVGADSVWDARRGRWDRFGRYRFELDGLLSSTGSYFAVTVKDHGFLAGGLDPLESSPLDNIEFTYPVYSPEAARGRNIRIGVYPNPYRLDHYYRLDGFEDPNKTGFIERERRIHFINLPAEATISIYSLDGDLIRRIDHPDKFLSDTESHCAWDLITRNTQAITSGIYYWVVESDRGREIGRLVVIK